MSIRKVAFWLVCVSAVAVTFAGAWGTSLSRTVPRLRIPVSLDAPPETIVAGMEQRDRFLRGLQPATFGGQPPNYVLRLVRRWSPGQTLRVAFLGGSQALQAEIAEVAAEWSKYANVKFDFGHNPSDGSYRRWTREDKKNAAEIRISFGEQGYWSVVGRDSIEPTINLPNEASMSFGAFVFARPANWKAVVLHEFGHALGLEHEHQHPDGGCDFRWDSDDGYEPTLNSENEYIPDGFGKRPGVYTVLGGLPNRWPRSKVDENLRQLKSRSSYEVSGFDRKSIMKYGFAEWMLLTGTKSRCYGEDSTELSAFDKVGIRAFYPFENSKVIQQVKEAETLGAAVSAVTGLDPITRGQFIRAVKDIGTFRAQNMEWAIQ